MFDKGIEKTSKKEVFIDGEWVPYHCRGDDTDQSREFYRGWSIVPFAQGSFTIRINNVIQGTPCPNKIYYRRK